MAMTKEQRETIEVLTAAHPDAMAKLRDTVMTVIDQAIEEGRREILREIAAFDPSRPDPCDGSASCFFCDGYSTYINREHGYAHKPDCLWLRAQAAVTP